MLRSYMQPDDYLAAYRWIQNKFKDDYQFPVSDDDIARQIEAAETYKNINDVESLCQWCDKFLNEEQEKKLRATIRVARLRNKRRSGKTPNTYNITLSGAAFLKLKAVAVKEKITLSEAIMRHLDDSVTL